jgi:REP element-mobilizing transposase RayT
LIRASPGLQSGEAGFQTRENALSCNDRALALVRMLRAPQSTRPFFVTSTTAGRRALLRSDRMAQLLVDVLAENRRKRRFLLHEFVIMPNHFHLLLTPAEEIPLEKALQFIKSVSPIARNGKFILLLKYGKQVRESPHSRRRGLQTPPHVHLGESGQSGLERETGAVCLVIGVSAVGIGRPATRAKALNLYTGTFSRV